MRSTLNVFLNESVEQHLVYFGQNSPLIAPLKRCTTAFMSMFHQNNSSHLRQGENMTNRPGLMKEERAGAKTHIPKACLLLSQRRKPGKTRNSQIYSLPCWKLFTVKRAITGFSHFASPRNYLMRLLGTLVCGWQSLTPP